MNRTIKHIVGCLVTLAMVAAGVHRLGFLTRPTGDNNTDNAFGQIDSFYSLPDNSLEVIVYGSILYDLMCFVWIKRSNQSKRHTKLFGYTSRVCRKHA